MSVLLKMLVPWFSVLFYWWLRHDAWGAILSYHVQILLWRRRGIADWFALEPTPYRKWLPLLLITAPLLVWGLPWFARKEVSDWLAMHGLRYSSFVVMAPYFGLIHPIVEQAHWKELREKTPWAHLFFAGYHGVVLASLLNLPGLILSLLVLGGASAFWSRVPRALAVRTHQFADTGIALAGLWFFLQAH